MYRLQFFYSHNQEKNKKNLIEAALNKMGISDKLKSKVYELSGGEQQRVALARNMIKPRKWKLEI